MYRRSANDTPAEDSSAGEHFTNRTGVGRRGAVWALALTAVAILAVVICVGPYTTAYRNARFRRMSLEELSRTQERYVNDPIFLTYFGRRLNDRQEFAKAVPVLERAAGLDPDSTIARDEWAKALIGSGHVSVAFGQLRQFVGTHPNLAEAHFLLAKFYLTLEDLEHASRALEKTVALNPNHQEAWSYLGRVRIKMANEAGAQTALERAIQLRPNSANDHLQLGVLLVGKDMARARAEFARAVTLAPNDAVAHREYSRFLLNTRDAAAAESEARRAVAINGEDALANIALGRCLLAEGKPGDSIPYLERAARLAPADPVSADELRRAYGQLGDRASADRWSAHYLALREGTEERRRLKDFTTAHPDDREAHRRYAAALARIGNVNGCVREHAFAGKIRPDNPKALTAAARDLDRYGFSAEALPIVRQALEESTSNPDAFETAGDILVNLGRLHEAAVDYEHIGDWKPNRRALYKRKIDEAASRIAASQAPAERLLRQAAQETDLQRRDAVLQQALNIDPENTRCMRALLHLQIDRKKSDAAIATARRLSAISPEDGTAHALLVVLQLETWGERPLSPDEDREMNAHLRTAEIDPSAAPTILYARGLLDLKRGQAQQAVQDLQQAARLAPGSLDVYRRLADARVKTGDSEGAKRAMAEFDRRKQEQDTLARASR